MTKRTWRAFLGLALVLGMGNGCATVTHIALKPAFWEDKQAVIGVAIANYPKSASYRMGEDTGNGSLLASLVVAAVKASHAADMKLVQQHFENQDAKEFSDVADLFVKYYHKHGMAAKNIGMLDLKGFKKIRPRGHGIYFDQDLSPLAAQWQIQKLLLVEVLGFGSLRRYSGAVAEGDPEGYFQAQAQLIDLRTHEVLWLAALDDKLACEPVPAGDWNQPPDYPNLTAALKQAMYYAKEYLLSEFFLAKEIEKHGLKPSQALKPAP